MTILCIINNIHCKKVYQCIPNKGIIIITNSRRIGRIYFVFLTGDLFSIGIKFRLAVSFEHLSRKNYQSSFGSLWTISVFIFKSFPIIWSARLPNSFDRVSSHCVARSPKGVTVIVFALVGAGLVPGWCLCLGLARSVKIDYGIATELI